MAEETWKSKRGHNYNNNRPIAVGYLHDIDDDQKIGQKFRSKLVRNFQEFSIRSKIKFG